MEGRPYKFGYTNSQQAFCSTEGCRVQVFSIGHGPDCPSCGAIPTVLVDKMSIEARDVGEPEPKPCDYMDEVGCGRSLCPGQGKPGNFCLIP